MKELISLIKIESMSSLEIAELTGKQHRNVLRDIRVMLSDLGVRSEMSAPKIDGVELSYRTNKQLEIAYLNKNYTLVLTTGYSTVLRKKVIDRWEFLEEQVEVLKRKDSSKKHQLAAMESLQHLLPDDLQAEAVIYMKANTVVNKATSNLFGFPKMLKKDDMSPDMLAIREKILDHYLMLFEFFEDNSKVADLLYEKYQPKRIESEIRPRLEVVQGNYNIEGDKKSGHFC